MFSPNSQRAADVVIRNLQRGESVVLGDERARALLECGSVGGRPPSR